MDVVVDIDMIDVDNLDYYTIDIVDYYNNYLLFVVDRNHYNSDWNWYCNYFEYKSFLMLKHMICFLF